MMTGLPAITSDVGDLGNLLKDGENGYLVLPLTESNFAAAYLKLFKAQNKQIEFSKKAYKNTQKFSFEQVELHWNKIFSEFRINN
jgi:glycosyltransferase involved in cell wall biosynthesis